MGKFSFTPGKGGPGPVIKNTNLLVHSYLQKYNFQVTIEKRHCGKDDRKLAHGAG